VTDEDFRALYNALRNSVFAFAVRRVGPESAADVVSETFEVAWRRRADFPVDRSSWAPWVVGIAKNKVLQELQRRSRKHHDNRFSEDWVGPHMTSTQEDIAQGVIDSEDARWVYGELTPAEQLLFDVAFLRDLSPEDGATLLGISPTAYTSRVSRLRQRIRSLSATYANDPESSTKTRGGRS
jgi:RNA polymerase sigma factor (sigma-70 family)